MRARVVLALAVFLAYSAGSGAAQGPPAPVPRPAPQGQGTVGGVAGGAPGPARLPPRDPRASDPSGTAVLRGRVVVADSGQPLRRVQIRATAPELREGRSVMTDDEGRYELTELPAGRYLLSASKGGYVNMGYGQRRPFEPGRPLELADGQVLEKVDFTMPRGGVITGRITDEAGEPVAGAMVQVARYQFFNGQRRLMMAPVGNGITQTDDRGEFRAYGVPPGEYYVSASMRAIGPMTGPSQDRSGYAATYYPGTPAAAEAQRVTVSLGEEVAGISFSLQPARTASISGFVRTADGRPHTSATLIVRQMQGDSGAGMVSFATGAAVRPDGSFTIANLPPGQYGIDVRSQAAGDTEFASEEVTVAGRDITGLLLVATKGATARGRIRLEGATTSDTLRPSEVRLFATAPDPMMGGISGGAPPVPRDDWTFEMTGLSGRRFIRVSAPPAWALKSIRVDGADVTDTAIDFRGDLDDVEIVLTKNQTDLSGMVSDDRGARAPDVTIVVFPTDADKWGPMTRFVRRTRPDQDGRYRLRGLPAATYAVVAVDYLEPGEETNPERLQELRQGAATVTLRDGETKTLDVKLATNLAFGPR